MKSVNTLKLLEDIKQVSNRSRIDTSEERQRLEKVHKFVDTYIVPKLNILDVENINTYQALVNNAVDIVIILDDLNIENNPNPILLNINEIGFLHSSDIKVKKSMGSKIADYIIRNFTYEEKIKKYIEEYITPMLEKLHQENIIIYNPKELDNKTKIANNRIDKLVKKFITDNTKNSLQFSLFNSLYNDDYIVKWDFLFSDNKQAKNDFVNILKEYIQLNIDAIDFKNIENIDYAAITGAKLD